MKTVVFFLQGGIGKHIAATAVAKNISKNFPDRKLIVICPYPEVFLNNPDIYRIYRSNTVQYFYEDFIKNKDTIFLGNEVYQSNEYVVENKHLIESWCNMFGLKYDGEKPSLFLNQIEIFEAAKKFKKDKPIFLLQTNGGPEGFSSYNWSRDLPPFIVNRVIDEYKDKYHILHIRRDDQIGFENVEKVGGTLREMFSLIAISDKRLLIDSFAQHASAALNLNSVVTWVGTSPLKLGYSIHSNIIPSLESQVFSHAIDGIIMEKEFTGLPHQCNVDINKLYDINILLKYIG